MGGAEVHPVTGTSPQRASCQQPASGVGLAGHHRALATLPVRPPRRRRHNWRVRPAPPERRQHGQMGDHRGIDAVCAARRVSALEEASARFDPLAVFNTDQGSQFTSAAFTRTLAAAGIRIAVDRRGR